MFRAILNLFKRIHAYFLSIEEDEPYVNADGVVVQGRFKYNPLTEEMDYIEIPARLPPDPPPSVDSPTPLHATSR